MERSGLSEMRNIFIKTLEISFLERNMLSYLPEIEMNYSVI